MFVIVSIVHFVDVVEDCCVVDYFVDNTMMNPWKMKSAKDCRYCCY